MPRTDQMEISSIRIEKAVNSRLSEVDFSTLVFGSVFSDHMFTAEFQDGHWSDGLIQPYGPLADRSEYQRAAVWNLCL